MVAQHRKMEFYSHFWVKIPIFGKSISGFLWGNYLGSNNMLGIFDFRKIPNSNPIGYKRLGGLGYVEIILLAKILNFRPFTWSFCAIFIINGRKMTK